MKTVYRYELANAMEARGLSTGDVAAAVGISRQAVRTYLQGRHLPSSATALKLAEALDTSALYGAAIRERRAVCGYCGTEVVSNGARVRRWCNSTCRDRWRRGNSPRRSAERLAIDLMCKRCEPRGVCFDGRCPLREWSPFALADDAITPLAIRRDPWTAERRAAASARLKANGFPGRAA